MRPTIAGATISGSISGAISTERLAMSGDRKMARNRPIRHSAVAVTRPKRSENHVADQKAGSPMTAP